MARTKGSVLSEVAKEKMRAGRAVVRYLESLDAPAPPEPATDTALVEAELARVEGLLAGPELRAPGGSSSFNADGTSRPIAYGPVVGLPRAQTI